MEMYNFYKQWYDCDGEKYSASKEIEMCLGANMRQVHGNKTIVTYDFREEVTKEKIELVASVNKIDPQKLAQALVHFGIWEEHKTDSNHKKT